MALVGYVIGAGIFLLAIPLLPFVVVIWILSRIVSPGRPRGNKQTREGETL